MFVKLKKATASDLTGPVGLYSIKYRQYYAHLYSGLWISFSPGASDSMIPNLPGLINR
jgi:hypothetical protein